MVARKSTTNPPFNKDSAEGVLLDQIFRTAGVQGGLGAADPYMYSPAAIKMMPGFEILQKLGDSQFRQACSRAAAREIKRRMKAGEVPKPERANFFATSPSATATATAASPTTNPPADDTVKTNPHIAHDWDLIEGTVETIDAEYYFVFCQLPWATKKEQLAVVVSEEGETIDISKKKSKAPLRPGALLAAFNVDSKGRSRHGLTDVRTVAVNKAIKLKQQNSADPTAWVSMQTIELPWEAEQKLHTYKIAEVPVEDGQTEVWLYIEAKRVGNQYVPPAETPSVPSSKPSASMGPGPSVRSTGPSNGSPSSGSGSSASTSASNSMDTEPASSRSKRRATDTSANASTGAATSASTATTTTANASALASKPPLLSKEQMDFILQQQQQSFADQMVAQQKAMQEAMEKEMRKLHVQMGQLHVNAAALQGIPRGLPPPAMAMGPHFPQQLLGNGEDDENL